MEICLTGFSLRLFRSDPGVEELQNSPAGLKQRLDAEGMLHPEIDSKEEFERAAGRTADPSTSLRFGRDDKGSGVALVGVVSGWEKQQVPSCPRKSIS